VDVLLLFFVRCLIESVRSGLLLRSSLSFTVFWVLSDPAVGSRACTMVCPYVTIFVRYALLFSPSSIFSASPHSGFRYYSRIWGSKFWSRSGLHHAAFFGLPCWSAVCFFLLCGEGFDRRVVLLLYGEDWQDGFLSRSFSFIPLTSKRLTVQIFRALTSRSVSSSRTDLPYHAEQSETYLSELILRSGTGERLADLERSASRSDSNQRRASDEDRSARDQVRRTSLGL